jgi:hypothetical protein
VLIVLLQLPAHASLITGPSDPNYTLAFQGASAQTFNTVYGFTVGTGPGDLKVDTGTFTDPAGLIFGTMYSTGIFPAAGDTFDKIGFGYNCCNEDPATNANARDYKWLQSGGGNTSGLQSNDHPWSGTIWDLGGQANQAVVFPIIDHGPLPVEAIEYTVYLTNNPNSTNLADWSLALLDTVYMQGWEPDTIALADGFTTVWRLPNNQTFRYVSVEAVGSQALPPYFGDEDEIDAVAGLTAEGQSVAAPEPGSLMLLACGLMSLGFTVRRLG